MPLHLLLPKFEITADMFSNVILIGKPTSGLDGKVQDMEIAMPIQKVKIENNMVVGDEEVPPDPSGSGKLTVIKLDARDNATPLAGVTFDCYNSNGQLVDTGTTDKSGKWIPKISKAGTYTVIERSTNNKYQLTEPTTLVITVPTDNDVTATFRDYPSQTVTMEKEDAVTGKPVPGCEYEIIQIDGKGVWRATGKTDASGKISWNDVPDGTYLVREVSTTDGYILDQTPQYVTVRNGQAPSLKFLDSKYPGLTITNAIQSRLIMFQSQPSDYYLVMQNLPDLIALIEEVESFSVSCRKVIAGYQNDLPYYSGMLDRVSIRDGKKSLSAIKKNVTVSVENGILTIRLFPLIKNLSARTKEYISLLISDAIKEYFTANPMLDFGCENCVIVINSHYARPELVRDNDSVEVSAIVNAIKTYFLTDDDGLHLAIYRTGTISDRHETEINVMKITDFVQYLIQHSRHAHS